MSIIQKIKAYLLCAVALVSVSVSAEEIQFEGVRYDINKKTKQAQVLKVSKEESRSLISIPKFVEHLGELYLVTSVANNAFANSNLSCISIPSRVTMVGIFLIGKQSSSNDGGVVANVLLLTVQT